MNRSRFVVASGAALTAVASRPPVRAAAPFRMIVTETEVPLVPNSVAWLAQSLGYFDRAGVDVELVKVQQTPSAIAALRSGQGEMANIATEIALQLLGRDQMNVRGVVSPDKALPFAILAKKSITKTRELEGKTFGVASVGSVDYETSRTVLEKLGVNLDRLQYLAVGAPVVRVQSLLAGHIDATAVSVGVIASIADQSGLRVLVDHADYFRAAPLVTKLSVVTDEVAKARPKDVQAVVRGLILASRDFAKSPDLWVNVMHKARPDIAASELRSLSAAYRTSWSVNGGLNLDALRFTTAALYRGPEFKDIKRIEPASWIDTSYIAAVLKSVGVAKSGDSPTV